MTATTIDLTSQDGHRFNAYKAAPAGKPKGAIVIGPEIFGVNKHIRAVADGYAADGYLAIAPALFDRGENDASLPVEKAREVATRYPKAQSYFYPAGHGFNCDHRGSYDATAAALARTRTLEFLAKYL